MMLLFFKFVGRDLNNLNQTHDLKESRQVDLHLLIFNIFVYKLLFSLTEMLPSVVVAYLVFTLYDISEFIFLFDNIQIALV